MSNTYSACKVIATVAGKRIQGFGESDMINVERDNQKFVKVTGADGRVSRSHNCANAGQLQFTLQQTSEANDFFSKLLATDELSLAGQFAVSITDLNGSTNIIGADCWLTGPPAVPMNKEITDRVWTIDVGDLYMYVGGNNGGNFLSGASNAISGIGTFIEKVTG